MASLLGGLTEEQRATPFSPDRSQVKTERHPVLEARRGNAPLPHALGLMSQLTLGCVLFHSTSCTFSWITRTVCIRSNFGRSDVRLIADAEPSAALMSGVFHGHRCARLNPALRRLERSILTKHLVKPLGFLVLPFSTGRR